MSESKCTSTRADVGARREAARRAVADVTTKILVMSVKGGVGKTTVAVNLAYAIARHGLQVGLLDELPSTSGDLGLLMRMALEKVAFLPFGLVVDQWRWKVFSGEIESADYNAGWWDLRTKYQGVAPAVARSETDFDPGAKYHIPGNVSYTRYFLARIMQFQFQRALCDVAGHEGELQACSIYGSKEAGAKFYEMLEAGKSQPWQDTLETLTGTRQMDATAIIDYFAPLMGYLKEQNAGRSCGW